MSKRDREFVNRISPYHRAVDALAPPRQLRRWLVYGLGISLVMLLLWLFLQPAIATAMFVLLALWPSLYSLAIGRFELSQPIHYVAAYLTISLGIRSYVLLAQGSYIITPVLNPKSDEFARLLVYGLALSAGGVVACFAGYFNSMGESWALRVPVPWQSWSDRTVIRSVVVANAVGMLGTALFILAGGGFGAVIGGLATLSIDGPPFLLYPLMWFLPIGWLVIWIRVLRGPFWVGWYAVLAAQSLLVILVFAVTSSKWLIFTLLLASILLFHVLRHRVRIAAMIASIATFLGLWPAFYAYRLGESRGLGDLPAAIWSFAREGPFVQVLNRSYGMDALLMVIGRVNSVLDLRLGATMADLAYFYVPRLFWNDKPVSFSRQFAEDFLSHTSIAASDFASPSLVGELYLNWHVPGVLIGFFLLGVLMRSMHVYLSVTQPNPSTALLYVFSLLLFVHLVEGSIAAQVELWLSWLLPLLLVLWIMGGQLVRGEMTPGSPRRSGYACCES